MYLIFNYKNMSENEIFDLIAEKMSLYFTKHQLCALLQDITEGKKNEIIEKFNKNLITVHEYKHEIYNLMDKQKLKEFLNYNIIKKEKQKNYQKNYRKIYKEKNKAYQKKYNNIFIIMQIKTN